MRRPHVPVNLGGSAGLAIAVAPALLIANLVTAPEFAAPSQLPGTLAGVAPLALAAMASTPAVLSGGGGIDLSVAPVMGLTNILLVTTLLGTDFGGPALAIPILLAIGAGIGAVNGLLVGYFRLPPVIATLGMFFMLSGLDVGLVPDPVSTHGGWPQRLAGSLGPVPWGLIVVAAPLLLWSVLRRSGFVQTLLAVGDDDAAAFSAGIRVAAVRIWAYALGGLIAAWGGIALTGLIRSADARTHQTYVLLALVAVALGGINLAGGRGGLGLATLGAVSIFLLTNLLSAVQVPPDLIQVGYGCALLLVVALGAVRLGGEV